MYRNILVLTAAAVFAQPPQTNRVATTEDFHGTAVTEHYRWLEDPDSPETKAWVAAQNKYSQAFLSAIPQRPAIRARLTELNQFERYPGGVQIAGGRIFFQRQMGLENQPSICVRESLSAKPRVLLDPNTLSADGTAAINAYEASPDGKWLAYATAKAGSDWVTWRVRNVDTGEDLAEMLEWSKFSGAEWDTAGAGFYYGRYPEPKSGNLLQAVNENMKLYYHRRGTPQSEDRLVYERPDQPRWSFSPTVSKDGRYLVIEVLRGTDVNNQIHYIDLSQPGAKAVPLIGEFIAAAGFLGNKGTKFYVRTNYQAPRYRIVEIDLASPAPASWRTVVAEGKDTLNQAEMAGDELVLNYLHDATGLVRIAPLGNPQAARPVPLPGNSTIRLVRDSAGLFTVSSFVIPQSHWQCEAQSCAPIDTPVLPFKPEQFETTQVFYNSTGGARVPMFLVHRKGLKPSPATPVLLSGYGGFNIPSTPGFSTTLVAWVERGGIYAVANLRGGGEYGEAWHKAGMRASKQNVFDDFINAAEWLIKNKYTSPPKLAIRGGSNGGLLVGAVLNQRPELFGAAIPAVGVMDMLRFDRFTIGHAWTPEYGSPKDAADFKVLYRYSPLHNIREGGKYPPTLILTADHDDRVVPAHSFKYAAALQHAQGGPAPVLARIESAAGHGGGKPTSKRIDEETDVLSFLAATLAPPPQAFVVSIDQDRLSGPVDFSFLNQPLTASDRIAVKGEHFVNAKGERVRFWGVNLAFGANFPEQKDAARIARRLRRLGVNLVRLHHMDTSPDANPDNARSILTTGPYPTLNPVSVARLRALLDAFKAEGIYINLNLHVGYTFRPEVDKVPGPVPRMSKPEHIRSQRMVDLQCEFARKLIDALKLKGDPVLAMVEINNESSLLFSSQANKNSPGADLNTLIEQDRAYLNRVRDAVREALGENVPVAGTQVEFGGPLNFDSHDGLSYHDDHFYIDHYNFPHISWDGRDWRIRDTSGAGSGYLQYLHKAFAREAGKPYTVSEFNQPYPNRYAAELDPTFAAFAAFQDWDGPIHFAYEHGREWDRNGPSGFNLNGDFTKLAAFGQAGWLYRKGIVQTAKETAEIGMPLAMRRLATEQRQQFNLARFFENNGIDPNVVFVHKVAIDRKAATSSQIPALTPPYRSDTGELAYDPARKLFTIAAPQAAGVFGFTGTEKTTAGAIDVELDASTRGFVSILLTSLDGKPIESSGRMLLTNPGFTTGAKQKFVNYPETVDWYTLAPDRPDKPSSPFVVQNSETLMERVDATLTLRTRAKSVVVYPLGPAGERLNPLAASKRVPGGFEVRLDAPAPWYEVTAQ